MKRAVIAALVFAAFWLVAWVSGYDFDERNPGVAYWLVVSLFFAGLAWAAAGGKT